MEDLGLEILARLRQAGMAQKDIARALGVTEAAVSQWVHGARAVSSEYLAQLVELAATVRQRIVAGGDWRDVLADWKPTGVIPIPGPGVPPQDAALYQAWEDASRRGDTIGSALARLQLAGHVVGEYGRRDRKTMRQEDFRVLRRLLRIAADALDDLEWRLSQQHPD